MLLRATAVAAGAVATGIVGANLAVQAAALRRIHTVACAPNAPVAIVLGARIADGRPMPMLAGRLDTTAALVAAGKVQTVLVSGDGNGASGDEITAMTDYLVERGVPREAVVTDPFGVCTYDSMVRAAETFGIEQALVVTQRFHLARSLVLCRAAGIDAAGVVAEDNCRKSALVRNLGREWLLSEPKAVLDVLLRPRPAAGT